MMSELFEQVGQIFLAKPVVAQHAERLVENRRDVLELARQLATQIRRKAIRREVATSRLICAADLERRRIATHAKEREVVRLADQLPASADALAIDREISFADQRGRFLHRIGLG